MKNSTAKLNKIERLKQKLPPCYFDIRSCDFNNLSEDERFYLKNFGIYNIKLEPSHFMLRARVGLGVKSSTLLEIVNIAKEFKLKILITTRAQLELHKIEPKDILKVYNSVNQLDITTHQTLTDNIRGVTADIYDGLAIDSYIDTPSIVKQFESIFIDNKELFGTLPRKFNTCLIGRVTPMLNPWANDLLFALAKKEDSYGFNIYLGGKNSEVAKDANIFVEPTNAPELFKAVVLAYKEYGLRGSRSKTRLFHLLESVGIDNFREKVEMLYGKKLQNRGKLLMKSSNYQKISELKDGTYAKVLECNYGEVDLDKFEEILKEYRVRVGSDQNLHIIGVKKESVGSTAPIRACAGSRYCPLSLWDIKQDIEILGLKELAKSGISIGFSGCLKGCGHHFHSDIGLVGLRTNLYGPTQKALRVYLGATELPEPQPARLLYYAVPLPKIDGLFKAIVTDFKSSGYKSFKEYSAFINSYSIEILQLWYLLLEANLVTLIEKELFFANNIKESDLLKLCNFTDINLAIKELSHKLWDN